MRFSPLVWIVLVLWLPVSAGADPARSPKPVDKAQLKIVQDWLKADALETKAKATAALARLDGLSVDEMERLLRAAHPAPKQSGLLKRQVTFARKPVPYLVRLPTGYDPAKSYPVMYFMWGPGIHAQPGIERWNFLQDWVVVSPSLPEDNPDRKGYPMPETGCSVFRLVMMDLFGEVNIDQDRVVVGGFSQGGVMAFWVAGFQPDRCAGGISGAAYSLYHFHIGGEPPLMGNMIHVPMYVVHGDQDNAVPLEAAHETRRELDAIKANHVYRELPGVGHDLPVDEQKRIATWAKDLRRNRWPRRVVQATSAKVNSSGRAFWIQLKSGGAGVLFVEGNILDGNRIELTTQKIKELELLLNDKLVDLTKEIVVTVNGEEIHRGILKPSARTMIEGFQTHKDPGLLYSVVLPVRVPQQ